MVIPPKKIIEVGNDPKINSAQKAESINKVEKNGNKVDGVVSSEPSSTRSAPTPAPIPAPTPTPTPAPTPAPISAPKPTRALNDPRYKSE